MKKLIVMLVMFAVAIISAAQSGFNDPKWFVKRDVKPIQPLLPSEWSQKSPFNDLLEQKSGICTYVANCQVLHYYRVPQTYVEFTAKDGTVFPITTFNHDIMLGTYLNGNWTEEEGYEVSKLFYYLVNGFSNLDEIFGVERKPCFGENYIYGTKDENFYEFYDKWLEQGIPIIAVCSSVAHCFIIDGRDSEGRYHLNLGWGGGNDYYAIPRNHDDYMNKDNGDNTYGISCTTLGRTVLIPKLFSLSTNITSKKQNKAHTNHFYNLNGQYVGETLKGLPRGIYVSNGKKYIVK